ncbi:hypothetical protein Cs7R123_60480 [Catellatospora sp. TT07R-123]|uniref:hypothetical protein n=1 Tax=Catellatospora sp. TT07R-123 TaxID=2733863 RepID=UPI001B017341|nr:hypothetical protein [Catellatospora sp. TT07R-123]GHJ48706.1 hypothetical protein Cs7R123_60480 [Catellatospora sp. TT07R-123]
MDDRDFKVRLWQEERAAIRHTLQLAVLWSVACLLVDGLILAALVLAGRDLTAGGCGHPANFTTLGAAAVLITVGGLGIGIGLRCRDAIERRALSAGALYREFAPRDPKDSTRTVPYGRPGEDAGLTTALTTAHASALLCGLVLAVVGLIGAC